MIIKPWTEQVLDNTSTHILVKKLDSTDDSIAICDLIIFENGLIQDILATDRYYSVEELQLTEQEIAELSAGDNYAIQ